ncbi:preprotein translocase subunit SecG [Leeia aquatica]|uniref:Protein-export membrane protein SecG n=1 Tax=Leeia aquatica TaxID=2725557 RepID=A0A847S9P0_9NEIS|nr:preprotein translocase subunit SecG [Leeia aquatica]NLR74069.1 preprotein translocase subunit SecG [Leeia aquatica]
MDWLKTLLLVVDVLAALIVIGLVLLQQGKGADMGASFGSGASGTLFGASGSANFLSRSTAIAATVFFAASLGLAVLAVHGQKSSSIMTQPAAATQPAPQAPAKPAGNPQVPN